VRPRDARDEKEHDEPGEGPVPLGGARGQGWTIRDVRRARQRGRVGECSTARLVGIAGVLYKARPDGVPDRRSEVSAAPVVVAEGLGRRFGELDAVIDLSLEIEDRKIFGFLGPNGAGKTTTIKMLCGLLRPTCGRARVVGFDVASQ